MITNLLIANRGEIARRIRRTAALMGIRTIAVYTAEESAEPHAMEADRGVLLEGSGPAPYLDIQGVIDAARIAGADAIHPGYGFLAENSRFAQAVEEAGLVWVGPPAGAIARMGDKIEAKRTAQSAGVPVLEVSEDDVVFPVLVKAAAGGGGKGMRIVASRDELDGAVAAARREAERSFGDGTIFIEPYLERVRHVEIQVLGDRHGNLIHLFERECSIQRRHQKVVEEAPSPVVDRELRARMGDAALALAREIGYRNAGTVEFLLDPDGSFYFIEMNTRLQVEHPVTEEITFTDLVEQQLLEAMGEPLSVDQPEAPVGHAIEVRLNSEDPSNEFLPATGELVGWYPSDLPVRTESAVEQGSVVGTTFDPLIAKVIAAAPTRTQAAEQLALALERMTIQGVRTNRDLLVSLLRSKEFVAGDTTTDFLEREAALAAVVLASEADGRRSAPVLASLPAGWRNSVMPPRRKLLTLGDEEVDVAYERRRDGKVTVAGKPVFLAPGTVRVDRTSVAVEVNRTPSGWWVHGPWGDVEVFERSPFPSSEVEEVTGSLVAPMPGSVVAVEVEVGEAVRKGQTLVVLEAMKMEHPIPCPEDGTVSEVRVDAGDQVERGTVLIVVEAGD